MTVLTSRSVRFSLKTLNRRVSRSHVEKLEEKLDGLVDLIRSAHETGVTPGLPLATSATVNTTQKSSSLSTRLPVQPIFPVPEQVPRWEATLQQEPQIQPSIPSSLSPYTAETGQSSSGSKSPAETQFKIDAFDLGSEDPDVLLTIFRNEMTPNFPFIDMSEFPRAEDLRRDRPSIYTVIMAVTTRNSLRGRELGKTFMKQLGERMVVNGERNMDLLLACLIYAAWYVQQSATIFFIHLTHSIRFRDLLGYGHQLTFLLSAVLTLSSDLGLNRPTYRHIPDLFERALRRNLGIPDFKDSMGTLEERRAFLGYFYLSSM